ncbi:MAG TPA: phosphoglycerate kinase [Bacillota bacterium]|nr:phosphoglycerate kinase [Bacillota bacterium]HOH10403.1 phosphoglycerate kinase [Bacillota bacterium]HOS50574.1 phosphoglycerate kinase [Bacillota bacterium]HOY88808.1 phosphoglycerate kinase [Bacillota bacterium]HPI01831.1 phosphoglycerate kinase [Bacillota bacterium]
MNKKTVRDIDVKGKRVLVRADFNVPQDKSGQITDDRRIREALPTIKYLLEKGASVVLASHLGRPNGVRNEKFTLMPVAERLSELLGFHVPLLSDCVGPEVDAHVRAMKPGEVALLENVRFHKEEEANDTVFAKELASTADIFVMDAFGTAHRAHASTEGVARHIPAVAGLLVEKELRIMGDALSNPKRPFVAVLGGAKVKDKIAVVENLLGKVDTLIIGGGMAYTFLRSEGYPTGGSLLDSERLDYCKDIILAAKAKGVKLLLPMDHVAATSLDGNGTSRIVDGEGIPQDMIGVDIGPQTGKAFAEEIKTAKTVVWNGPMGVFEVPEYSKGTLAIANALVESSAVTIVGGGDSAAAIEKLGLADKVTHVSTGGGASLEFLEGKVLPGIDALQDL